MYDPASGRQVDHVPSTNGDISDPDKRFKRGFGVFAIVVLLVVSVASGFNPAAMIAATAGVVAILAGIFSLSMYDDRRMLRRHAARYRR
jgi:hypothetical protein